MLGDEPLVDGPGAVHLAVPELELDVGAPRRGAGPPRHPSVEHLAGVGHRAERLLHVRVLEPQLVDAGQQSHCAVPHVARVAHAPAPHLELGVPHPERVVALRRGGARERALVDGPRAVEVALPLLPLGVLDPCRCGTARRCAADCVLELFALAEAVVGELDRIRDLPLGSAGMLGLPPLPGLADDLLGRDLHLRRGLVLDARHAREPRLGKNDNVGVGGGLDAATAATGGGDRHIWGSGSGDGIFFFLF